MDLGIASVAAITVIAYLAGEVCKAVKRLPDNWIPVICGIVGAILGVVGLYHMPDFPATDVLTALAVGIVSGFAATGINQIYKQFSKNEERG
ncbi:MAG: enolase [Lactobacillus sp.]|nr:MAG: enolase [Lactobacillus sp.]